MTVMDTYGVRENGGDLRVEPYFDEPLTQDDGTCPTVLNVGETMPESFGRGTRWPLCLERRSCLADIV